MASAAFEPGKPGEDAIEVARLVERSLKQSHAVDTEALCVVAGRKVRGRCWGILCTPWWRGAGVACGVHADAAAGCCAGA